MIQNLTGNSAPACPGEWQLATCPMRAAILAAMLAGFLAAMLGVASVGVAEETNPYLTIVERNPFGLKDPPPPEPPPPPPPPPEPPKPSIKLTGLTDLFNKKRALFEFTEPAPGSKPINMTMMEGDIKDGIEVVSIDMTKNEVVMKISGSTTNITFPKPDTTAAAAPPAAAGKPGVPGYSRPNPVNMANPALSNPTASAATTGSGPVVFSSRTGGGQSNPRGVTVAGAAAFAPAPVASPAAVATGPSYNASATAAARNQLLGNDNARAIPTRVPRVGPLATGPMPTPGTPQSPATDTPPPTKPTLTPEQLNRLMLWQKAQNPGLPFPVSRQEEQGIQEILNENR